MCTSWCRFNFELSTKAFPHSAHTWTRGPWVCRCFRMALLSRNIFVQPLWGQGTVLGTSSLCFLGLILTDLISLELETATKCLLCEIRQLFRVAQVNPGNSTRGQLFARHVFGVIRIQAIYGGRNLLLRAHQGVVVHVIRLFFKIIACLKTKRVSDAVIPRTKMQVRGPNMRLIHAD